MNVNLKNSSPETIRPVECQSSSTDDLVAQLHASCTHDVPQRGGHLAFFPQELNKLSTKTL